MTTALFKTPLPLLGSFLVLVLYGNAATAHGTHSWFDSPQQNETVSGEVTFAVKTAAEVANRYVNLKITRQDDGEIVWQSLVEKRDGVFAATLDLTEWSSGLYQAESVLLGEVFSHPRYRLFTVQAPPER